MLPGNGSEKSEFSTWHTDYMWYSLLAQRDPFRTFRMFKCCITQTLTSSHGKLQIAGPATPLHMHYSKLQWCHEPLLRTTVEVAQKLLVCVFTATVMVVKRSRKTELTIYEPGVFASLQSLNFVSSLLSFSFWFIVSSLVVLFLSNCPHLEQVALPSSVISSTSLFFSVSGSTLLCLGYVQLLSS